MLLLRVLLELKLNNNDWHAVVEAIQPVLSFQRAELERLALTALRSSLNRSAMLFAYYAALGNQGSRRV